MIIFKEIFASCSIWIIKLNYDWIFFFQNKTIIIIINNKIREWQVLIKKS